jgi:hypothetical protein
LERLSAFASGHRFAQSVRIATNAPAGTMGKSTILLAIKSF